MLYCFEHACYADEGCNERSSNMALKIYCDELCSDSKAVCSKTLIFITKWMKVLLKRTYGARIQCSPNQNFHPSSAYFNENISPTRKFRFKHCVLIKICDPPTATVLQLDKKEIPIIQIDIQAGWVLLLKQKTFTLITGELLFILNVCCSLRSIIRTREEKMIFLLGFCSISSN